MIPLIDLSVDSKTLDRINTKVRNVILSNSYILGSKLLQFEKEFADFLGARYAIGVANGTDALRLGLRSVGIGPGDSVLTVSFTSPFTAIAIIEEGAIPVFCDIDEKTYTIDPADIERKIDKTTKAIVPVHIYGNPCNLDKILQISKKHNLKVIEDACQAHGAKYKGLSIGTFGDAAAFSFYPTKNLGAMGDAGIAVTNKKQVAAMIRMLRHGGQRKRFWHEYKGTNSRLDEIQAVILSAKLQQLKKNNQLREKLAQRYKTHLKPLPLSFQESHEGAESAFHLFTIRTKKRGPLRKFLLANAIGCDIYYPYPVHTQPAFKKYSHGTLNVTEQLTRELLALPLFPHMDFATQDRIIQVIYKFFKKR